MIGDQLRDEVADAIWTSLAELVGRRAAATVIDAVGHIHNRMPMSVDKKSWDVWLDPATSAADAKLIMAPPGRPAGDLRRFQGCEQCPLHPSTPV